MPWQESWVPAPSDHALLVVTELPPGLEVHDFGHREAFGRGGVQYHFCHQCGGWIEGHAPAYSVDNLGPLSGRHGTEYFCRRCGAEIGFFGIMS